MNAIAIVRHATAYPFRLPDQDMMCVICHQKYKDPAEFRGHVQSEHKNFDVKASLCHIKGNEVYPKVDCSDLRCRICEKSFDDLKNVAVHLREEHGVKIKGDNLGLQVFKFTSNGWTCAECLQTFPSLRVLSRHTVSHYRSVVCFKCGKSYSTRTDLEKHSIKSHTNLMMMMKPRKPLPETQGS